MTTDENSALHATKKLGMGIATVILAGEMAGSGMLALPKAVSNSGWIGLLLILLCCLNSGYSGIRLARCWIILEERYPELVGDTRSPYPAIAFRAYGNKMKKVVSVCVSVTLFGTSTVFLLLVAQMLQALLHQHLSLSYCYWILIIGGILIPLTLLETPKDFWPVAVFALGSTTIASLLTFIQVILDYENNDTKFKTSNPSLKSLAFSFGTILFAFGGASTFPTVQNDMADRKQFSKSVFFTFLILFLLYFPIASGGYFVFGSTVRNNIVQSITDGTVTNIIQCLLVIHLFFAFVIAINPSFQEMEEYFNIPKGLNLKRCLFRSVLDIFIIFIGLSIPHFGNILALIGGSTVTALTFVFPPLFYMKLCDQKNTNWPSRTISLHERVYLWELIIIGALGGAAATWSAVTAIVSSTTFTIPCYISPNNHCYLDPSTCN